MTADRTVSLFDVDDVEEFGAVASMVVAPVSTADVDEFARRWHYTEHGGSKLWRYGLWDGPVLVGVVAYNMPTMRACASVFGPDEWRRVAHMGRLVCADAAPRNCESRLIAGSLRMLSADRPELWAVLTFAATSHGHVGYVYQATNALYTGTGGSDIYYLDEAGQVRGNYVGRIVTKSRAAELGWTRVASTPKHRYVYLIGDRTTRREARRRLLLPVLPYPKGEAA